ncbi:MAG TPA: RNA methyltransferase [Arenimonas sp.]|nr:RNA methyltransferase [Arenimonas sp.]
MKSTLRIVLVGTQHPGNIGSAARAMKTMGLYELHLVRPHKFPHPEATALAAGATDLLDSAVLHESLADAVADCHFVVGTSSRRREVPLPEYLPRQAAEQLLQAGISGNAALVFGCERTGLENEDLQRCHATVCIPANPEYASLNLAAAVQVLAYEFRMAMLASGTRHETVPISLADPDEAPASHEDMERFFGHLTELMEHVDFHKGRAPEIVTSRLRRLYLRAQMDKREIKILRGLFSDTQRMLRISQKQQTEK